MSSSRTIAIRWSRGGRLVGLVATMLALAIGAGANAEDVVYRHAAIATDHPVASEAGAELLRGGGNAVDAAVAASFCLSVVRPYSCGIGGGGFMLIHVPGKGDRPARRIALDYRETAPAAVGPEYFAGLDDDTASRFGVHAVAVPGTVAGLLYALEHHGTRTRAEVLAPAIRAAEQGFVADAHLLATLDVVRARLERYPRHRVAGAYLWSQIGHDGALRVGDRVTNPEQTRALRLIAADGADAFYRGPIGAAIVDVVRAGGGVLTAADLDGYRPRTLEPLAGRFGPFEILAMPPPSSGGIATLQILGIAQRLGARPPAPANAVWRHNDVRSVHLLAESMKLAFADRATWGADPDFAPVPIAGLLDPAYLDRRAALIDPERTGPPDAYGSMLPPPSSGGTSHLSVLDAGGMAVACTETINLRFGSLVAVPGYGFALNDEMDDFTTTPGAPNAFGLRQSDRNVPEPGKRPLSSMSPTIVLRDGRAVLVAGASGGPRIITGTVQCILNCLLHGMSPNAAVAAPRFHHQWMPDRLEFEKRWTDAEVVAALGEFGHATGTRPEVGNVQIVRSGPDGIRAASDPRKGGAPAGF